MCLKPFGKVVKKYWSVREVNCTYIVVCFINHYLHTADGNLENLFNNIFQHIFIMSCKIVFLI